MVVMALGSQPTIRMSCPLFSSFWNFCFGLLKTCQDGWRFQSVCLSYFFRYGVLLFLVFTFYLHIWLYMVQCCHRFGPLFCETLDDPSTLVRWGWLPKIGCSTYTLDPESRPLETVSRNLFRKSPEILDLVA